MAGRGSGLRDREFREDLLDPLERLLGRGRRRRPVLNDLGPGRLPDMLVLDLGISWVGGPEGRHGRAEQAVMDGSRPVRILGVEPPRVVLHDRPASPADSGPAPSSDTRSELSAGSNI